MNEAHRHTCPSCHQRPLCREDCTVETDEDGTRRGHATLCPACFAPPPSAEEQLEELRAAARALVSELEDLSGDKIATCEATAGCDALATRGLRYEGDAADFCDEHAQQVETGPEAERPLSAYDLSYAPALRRLRALVAG